MADLRDAVNEGLIKVQAGIENSKKKLEVDREFNVLRQELSALLDEKGKVYFKMGQYVYLLVRQGSIENENLVKFKGEIMNLDKEIWRVNNEIAVCYGEKENKCDSCGQALEVGSNFCTSCGTKIGCPEESCNVLGMCPHCDEEVMVDANFCQCCGHEQGGMA